MSYYIPQLASILVSHFHYRYAMACMCDSAVRVHTSWQRNLHACMYKFVIVQGSKVVHVNCFRFALSLTSGINSFNTSPNVQLMMQAEFIKYDSDRLGVNLL